MVGKTILKNFEQKNCQKNFFFIQTIPKPSKNPSWTFFTRITIIYLLKVKNGNTRRLMCDNCSEFRDVYRTQSNILAFGC